MTSFYLASRVRRRNEMIGYARELTALGHTVTSTWITADVFEANDAKHANRDAMSRERRGDIAQKDLADVQRANAIILFTEHREQADPPAGNGRLFEFGYAAGKHKLLYAVGPEENLFVCLRSVLWFPGWQLFYEHIEATTARQPEEATRPQARVFPNH